MNVLNEIRPRAEHLTEVQSHQMLNAVLASAPAAPKGRRARVATVAAFSTTSRTRWALPSLALGGAALAAAAVVVVPAGTPSAAAQVLQDAASLSASATSIAIPAGEYLRIESKSTELALWDVDMPAPWARFNNGDPRAAEAGLDVVSTRTIYVPADHADDWIVRDADREVVRAVGDRAAEARQDWRLFAASPGQTTRYPGGKVAHPEGGKTSYLDDHDVNDQMPRDPGALLNWWRDRSGLSGEEADRWAVEAMAEKLSMNLAPADLRSAAFDALALIDGTRVVSTNGDLSTLAFPWRLDSRNLETRLTIDTARGLVTGVSELEFVPGTKFGSPVVLQETTVSTEIVATVAR